ncbi:hypothetical protein Hamer_G019513 [Homarus americanus]|uniref:Uncharacterized protein n=1 Tax=Homarus americanus TaxID=6706 RepID=A0A8J5MJF9_HOMAM|nr:hypothetical protein Hamer_G019513 [Homarus americanus]
MEGCGWEEEVVRRKSVWLGRRPYNSKRLAEQQVGR